MLEALKTVRPPLPQASDKDPSKRLAVVKATNEAASDKSSKRPRAASSGAGKHAVRCCGICKKTSKARLAGKVKT